ncbi:MAG: ABC transporter permease subunit [Candidatus Hydrogenedentes bacterium]|nr:ABC transporter permease subunit [Candidatus Hydrogenedentota bacterium]
MSAVMDYMRGPWYIALFTWREGIRKKTLVGFLILSLLVIFGASFMSAFLNQSTASAESQSELDLKLIKDICVTTISIFGMLIAIFISASVVPNEVENKVIYTVLSKPVRRLQYLLGKFIGVQMIILANLLLMAGLFFIAIWSKQGVMPTLLLWSVSLTYFEFLVVSAFTFAISCTSTSAVLPTIGGLFIYMIGNLTEYLKDVHLRARESEEAFSMLLGNLAQWLYNILPNLQKFSMKNYILDMPPNDPLPPEVWDQIPNLLIYGLAYALSGYLIAYWVFRRKEL